MYSSLCLLVIYFTGHSVMAIVVTIVLFLLCLFRVIVIDIAMGISIAKYLVIDLYIDRYKDLMSSDRALGFGRLSLD